MFKNRLDPVWIGVVVLSGIIFMGQDCLAQTDPCDSSPCLGIPNAVPGTCTPVGGSCAPADDFTCSCDVGSTWQDATNVCAGSPPSGPPAPVAKTGQTACYDNSGNVIDCAGTGQDGDYQMGVDYPDPRYTDNGDGTVTDNLTGLVWLQDFHLLGEMTWIDAVTTCNDLVYAGYDNWRLPNGKEALSVIDYSQYAPRLTEGHPFIITPVKYNWTWTSTTPPETPSRGETLALGIGDIGSEPKTYGMNCWCCRGPQ